MSQRPIDSLRDWFASLKEVSGTGGPARGTIVAGLFVLERLKTDFDLELSHHQAPGRAQIKGLSRNTVAALLKRFGETRPFLKEGGRTNRGAPGDVAAMLACLRDHHLDQLPCEKRAEVLHELQTYLVDRVRDFHNRQRLKIVYDPTQATWHAVSSLLKVARQHGKEGMVAQYLVGAKLSLRFPDLKVENLSYSTADDQLGRPGDFYIGSTAFHVTVAPMPPVFEKCRTNLQQGYRVYLLVPDRALIGARQNAETATPGQISVESIESFVSNNIEEIAQFAADRVKTGIKSLLEEYNRRVDTVENDKSLLVEIPRNLL